MHVCMQVCEWVCMRVVECECVLLSECVCVLECECVRVRVRVSACVWMKAGDSKLKDIWKFEKKFCSPRNL